MAAESHPTLQVLAHRDVQFFLASRFFSAMSRTLLRTAIAWHVYDLTGSAFHLGLVGLIQFLPALPLSLVGGAVADSFDRRRIVLITQTAALLASALLWWSAGRPDALWFLYALILALAITGSFENPARQAMLPTLVSRELFPSAVTLHATVQNLAWMSGPVVLGFVLDAYGISVVYALNAVLVGGTVAGLLGVHLPPVEGERRRVSIAAIREGIAFVWNRPVILSCMALDMFAVIFASATALLPVYAETILEVGPRGYGLLSAALETGTFAMAVVLLVRRPILRPGRALLIAVAIYGLATIAFGLSRSFPLSLAAFALAGMADQISMVTRATIVQLSTPDALRGRVSSVNMIFINASNQLGAAESGFLAALTSATFSVVAGGVACLGVLGIIHRSVPKLARYTSEKYNPIP